MTNNEIMIKILKEHKKYWDVPMPNAEKSPGLMAAQRHREELVQSIDGAIEALKFKDYFDGLYGQGLEIANWHQNGDLEPFDNFYESALEDITSAISKDKNLSAKKIEKGIYEYKGYRLFNYGYYEPEHCTWWEAVNIETGCADYHAHTKKEIMELIDADLPS